MTPGAPTEIAHELAAGRSDQEIEDGPLHRKTVSVHIANIKGRGAEGSVEVLTGATALGFIEAPSAQTTDSNNITRLCGGPGLRGSGGCRPCQRRISLLACRPMAHPATWFGPRRRGARGQ
jgi:hypothetical protein